jgi:hypothetical protein
MEAHPFLIILHMVGKAKAGALEGHILVPMFGLSYSIHDLL